MHVHLRVFDENVTSVHARSVRLPIITTITVSTVAMHTIIPDDPR